MPLPTDLIVQIKHLDPMPMTAQRLLRALQDEAMGPAQIAGFVEYDPAMASVVLRLANSAAYGASRTTTDLRAAVLRIGTATLIDIVLGDTLQRIKATVPMYGLGEDELWMHSVAASLAVKAIRQECPAAGVPEWASVAALLHDLGKLVMARYMKADVRTILARAAARHITFVEAERDLLGCDHTEVGGALGRSWGLPDDITEAIVEHHRDPLPRPTPALDAVVLANLIAKSVGAGLGAEGLNISVDPGAPRRLGLDFLSYPRVCLLTATWLNEVKATYHIKN